MNRQLSRKAKGYREPPEGPRLRNQSAIFYSPLPPIRLPLLPGIPGRLHLTPRRTQVIGRSMGRQDQWFRFPGIIIRHRERVKSRQIHGSRQDLGSQGARGVGSAGPVVLGGGLVDAEQLEARAVADEARAAERATQRRQPPGPGSARRPFGLVKAPSSAAPRFARRGPGEHPVPCHRSRPRWPHHWGLQ